MTHIPHARPCPAAIPSDCWAIHRDQLEPTLRLYRGEGVPLPEAAVGTGRGGRPMTTEAGLAIIPIAGVITQRPTWLGSLFGWTSAMEIGEALDAALSSPAVRAIVFDVVSPGGEVYGTPELAAKIFAARGQKPMVAVANSLAASAAYWLASAADQVVVTPSGEIGSIGVVMVHLDRSAANERMGLRFTTISAPAYKTEGTDLAPLGQEARAFLQSRVDEYYSMFTTAVAKHRGTSPDAVRRGYGEGRVVGAREAVRVGLADRVSTLEAVLTGLRGMTAGGGASQDRLRRLRLAEAEAGGPVPAATDRSRARRLRLLEAETGNVPGSRTTITNEESTP